MNKWSSGYLGYGDEPPSSANPDTGTPYDARPFGNAGGGKGASTSTPKLNANPGPSIAHDFNCTHDPCMCTSTQELREQIADKELESFIRRHKLSERQQKELADIISLKLEARIAAVLDDSISALEDAISKQELMTGEWGGIVVVPVDYLLNEKTRLEALRQELSASNKRIDKEGN